MDFCEGDRVKLVRSRWRTGLSDGMTGTIVEIDAEQVGIEFDENFGGHNLGGLAKRGHGWWVSTSDIALIDERPHLTPCNTDDFLKAFLDL